MAREWGGPPQVHLKSSTHLVIVDGAKVADDVDDSKDKAALGEHGQVGAVLVAIDRVLVGQRRQILPDLHAAQPQLGFVQRLALFIASKLSLDIALRLPLQQLKTAHMRQLAWQGPKEEACQNGAGRAEIF